MEIKKIAAIATIIMFLLVYPSFALTISNVVAEPGLNFAVIKWNTDINATGFVDFALSKDQTLQRITTDTLARQHVVVLKNLENSTTYYFRVGSEAEGKTIIDDNNGNFYSFTTWQQDVNAPELNVVMPGSTNKDEIDINITTEPMTTLKFYVNGNFRRKVLAETGTITIKKLPLDASREINTILIKAEDAAGNLAEYTKTIYVDVKPPTIQLQDLPELINRTTYQQQGTIDEKALAEVYIKKENKDYKLATRKEVNESFSLTLSFTEGDGKYEIKYIFTDSAGNKAELHRVVLVDVMPPKFEKPGSLSEYSPSYVQEITINGKVSEKAKIIVYRKIEDEKDYSKVAEVSTDDNGNFKVDVNLLGGVSLLTEVGNVPIGIEGTASAGTTTSYNYVYAPDIINQELKKNVALKLVAIDQANHSTSLEGSIEYTACSAGSDWSFETDFGGTTQPLQTLSGYIIPGEELKLGYAELGFNVYLKWQGYGENPTPLRLYSIPIRLSPAEAKKRNVDLVDYSGIQVTPYGRSYVYHVIVPLRWQGNESDFNKKFKFGKLNTINIPIMLELQYQYEEPYQLPVQTASGRYRQASNLTTKVQRLCIDAVVQVEPAIPPDKIPRKFLNFSSNALEKTIKAIDGILKILEPVTKFTFFGCLGTWVLNWFSLVSEKFNCELSGVNMQEIAEAYYSGNTNGLSQKEQRCLDSVKNAIKVEQASQWVCDRIFCPAAKTISYHAQTYKGDAIFGKVKTKCSIASSYLGYKDEACKKEYKRFYDSVCIGMDEWGEQTRDRTTAEKILDLFNDQSGLCERKQNITGALVEDSKGNRYFVTSDGRAYEVEGTIKKFGQLNGEGITQENIPSSEKLSDSYVEVTPGTKEFVKLGKEIPVDPSTGFVAISNYNVKQNDDNKINIIYDNQIIYTVNEICSDNKNTNCYRVEGQQNNKRLVYIDEGLPIIYDYIYIDANGKPIEDNGKLLTPQDPEDLRNLERKGVRIPGFNTITTNRYIIDPTSGLLNTLRCGCLPGFAGYLYQIRDVLSAIKSCTDSVLLTGEIDQSLCKQMLTYYACDVILWGIGCLAKRFDKGFGYRASITTSPAKLFKAMTSASSAIQNQVRNRYGTSNMYQVMFSQRKLLHSTCLYFFTGDFELDFNQIMQESARTVTEPGAFISPTSSRRFTSFDPSTGYGSFMYHIGFAVIGGGLTTSYRLELVCSDSLDCNQETNNPEAPEKACDCFGIGEQTWPIKSGTVQPGQSIGINTREGEVYFPVKNSPYRFDKARLVLTYIDNKGQRQQKVVERKLTIAGGKPPLACKLSLHEGFICKVDIGYGDVNIGTINPSYVGGDTFYVGDTLSFSTEPINIELKDETMINKEVNYKVRLSVFDENNNEVLPLRSEISVTKPRGNKYIEIDPSKLFNNKIIDQSLIIKDVPQIKISKYKGDMQVLSKGYLGTTTQEIRFCIKKNKGEIGIYGVETTDRGYVCGEQPIERKSYYGPTYVRYGNVFVVVSAGLTDGELLVTAPINNIPISETKRRWKALVEVMPYEGTSIAAVPIAKKEITFYVTPSVNPSSKKYKLITDVLTNKGSCTLYLRNNGIVPLTTGSCPSFSQEKGISIDENKRLELILNIEENMENKGVELTVEKGNIAVDCTSADIVIDKQKKQNACEKVSCSNGNNKKYTCNAGQSLLINLLNTGSVKITIISKEKSTIKLKLTEKNNK